MPERRLARGRQGKREERRFSTSPSPPSIYRKPLLSTNLLIDLLPGSSGNICYGAPVGFSGLALLVSVTAPHLSSVLP